MQTDRPVRWNAVDLDGIEPHNIAGARYSPTQVDTALLTLACSGGSAPVAKRALAGKGIVVSCDALNSWRLEIYPNRYRAIAEKHRASIEGSVVAAARAIAIRGFQATALALDLETDRIAVGDIRDAAGSARNTATAAAIAVDKWMLLEGRPTAIHETRTSDDILRGLAAKGYVDAEVIDEKAELTTTTGAP